MHDTRFKSAIIIIRTVAVAKHMLIESEVFAWRDIWYKCKVNVLPLANMCDIGPFGIEYDMPTVYRRTADSPKIFPMHNDIAVSISGIALGITTANIVLNFVAPRATLASL